MTKSGQQSEVTLPVRLAIRLRWLVGIDGRVPGWLQVAASVYLAERRIVQRRSLEIVILFGDDLPQAVVRFATPLHQSGMSEQARNNTIVQAIAHFSMMNGVSVRREFFDLSGSERMKYPIRLGQSLVKGDVSEVAPDMGYRLVEVRPGERVPPPHERRAG